jgi:hypothetical protein
MECLFWAIVMAVLVIAFLAWLGKNAGTVA